MISEKIINDETKYVKDAIYSILKECNINFDNIKLFLWDKNLFAYAQASIWVCDFICVLNPLNF